MARGALITVEGGEGVGKTTSLNTIVDFIARRGTPVVTTREPGGTDLGESVRAWILDGDHGPLTAETEALLMFAARAEHLHRVIRPALGDGSWVVCDRFTDATLAYQGGGRGADPDLLAALAEAVHDGTDPDLTLLLDAPVEVGLGRIANRSHDHFEREEAVFFEHVRDTYLRLADREPDRIRVIDASASPADVARAIESELDAFCTRFAAREAVA